MRFALSLALAVLAGVNAAAANDASPAGRWRSFDDKTGKQTGVIEIYREGDVLRGKIVSNIPEPSDPPNPVCKKCEGAKHNAPIIGLVILEGFKKDGDMWDDGTILEPRTGRVYSGELRLGDGGKTLLVRGFIGISLLGRTQTWLRAE